jgi:poly(glycerol-phosphate) alpha-glucosyltransferase
MRRAVMETPCDLLHSHALWQYPSFLAKQWRARFRRPHLISPRGALDPWALSHSRWKKKLAGLCFENKHLFEASCLHALSTSEARSIRRYALRNPIAIIPNAVDLPLLEKQKAESRKQKVLLFLGRLHPKKGLIPLLRSWAELKKTESRKQNTEMWNLLIAGWDQGGHEAELKRCCRDLGIESSVQFHGPAHGDAKNALFRQADAFILPSFSEGLPVAVLEAWSYALPVFMTEACNLPEGFEHGAAFKLKVQETKIQGLTPLGEVGDDELRTMGARGRRLVEDRFTWPAVASQMKAVYDWLLGGGSAPPTILLK